jgi:hypothetical protein
MAAYVLILLLLVSNTMGRKVGHRFINQPQPMPRCNFAMPGVDDVEQKLATLPKDQFFRSVDDKIRRFNCTYIKAPLDTGSPQGNGSYTGIAGMLQRNEVDIAGCFYRTDFFEELIGFPSLHGFPADVTILSRQSDRLRYNSTVGLAELWFSGIDALTMEYMLFSLYIFSLVHLMTQLLFVIGTNDFIVSKRMAKRLSENVYQTLTSLIDRGSFNPRTKSGNLIIFALNVFIVFFMHGFVLGCIGAGLVSWVDPPVINSLEEFTNTSKPKPTILKQGWLLPVVEKSGPGQEFYHLKQIIHADPDGCLLASPADLQNLPSFFPNALQSMVDNEKALMSPNYYADYIEQAMCEWHPQFAKYIGRSRRLFAPGFFTIFLSRKIDPALRVYWNHLMGSVFDSGVISFLGTQMISSTVPTFTGKPYSGKKCNARAEQDDSSAEAFGLGMFQNLFIICFVSYGISLLVLMIERKLGKISSVVQMLCKQFGEACTYAFGKLCHLVMKILSH